MAGAGAKKFPAFSKLASDDVNNYLMDQTIMRFATTTARDAAFGGLGEPTLAEGMTCYLDNTNEIQSYNGSNWVSVADTTSPRVLQIVQGTTSTQATFSSATYAATGITATITPKSTASKIAIFSHIGGVNKQSSNTGTNLALYRNGSSLLFFGARIGFDATANETNSDASVVYLDSPNTASAVTYAIFGASSAGTGFALTQHQTATSSIILCELSL